jgi:hypothetical protein
VLKSGAAIVEVIYFYLESFHKNNDVKFVVNRERWVHQLEISNWREVCLSIIEVIREFNIRIDCEVTIIITKRDFWHLVIVEISYESTKESNIAHCQFLSLSCRKGLLLSFFSF